MFSRKDSKYISLFFLMFMAVFSSAFSSGLSDEDSNIGHIQNSAGDSHSSGSDSEESSEGEENSRATGTGQEHPQLIYKRRRPGPSARMPNVKVYLLASEDPLLYPEYLHEAENFFDPIPCKVNRSAWWYGKESTRSKPKSWDVIHEGTHIALSEVNPSSIGEHWAYFIERPQGTFVITFGKGKLLREDRLVGDFGRQIVRNTDPHPKELPGGGLEGVFQGENGHDVLGKRVQGYGYCKLVRSLVLFQLPELCDQLLELSRNGAAELLAEAVNWVEVPREKLPNGFTVIREGETKEIDGRTYTRVMDVLYEVGLGYQQALNRELSSLVSEDPHVEELLPRRPKEDEGDYNSRVADQSPESVLLMDKKEVKDIEVCDLLQHSKGQLVHVKLSTKGSELNHLLGQGHSSADLLRNNPTFRAKVPKEVVYSSILNRIKGHINPILKGQIEELNRVFRDLYKLRKELRMTGSVKKIDIKGVSSIPTKAAVDRYGVPVGFISPEEEKLGRYKQKWEFVARKLVDFRYNNLRDKLRRLFNGPQGIEILIRRAIDKIKDDSSIAKDLVIDPEDILQEFNAIRSFIELFSPERIHIIYAIGVSKARLERENLETCISLIPLGPRVNLRLYVNKLRDMGFGVGVQFIPEESPQDETVSSLPETTPNSVRSEQQNNEIRQLAKRQRLLAPPETRIDQFFTLPEPVISEDSDPEIYSFENPLQEGALTQNYRFLRVHYSDGVRPDNVSLFSSYVLGPTKPDGNCFFHAALTDGGVDYHAMVQRASEMRTSLVDIVLNDLEYLRRIKVEMLSEHANHPCEHVPRRVRKMLASNEKRDKLKKEFLDFFEDKYSIENGDHPEIPYDPDFAIHQLPDGLRAEPFSQDILLEALSLENVRGYLQRYRSCTGPESYIPVPVGRGQTEAMGSIIAEVSNVRINYFTLDRRRGRLNYSGAIGSTEPRRCVSILVDEGHYWCLYNQSQPDPVKEGIKQAAENS